MISRVVPETGLTIAASFKERKRKRHEKISVLELRVKYTYNAVTVIASISSIASQDM